MPLALRGRVLLLLLLLKQLLVVLLLLLAVLLLVLLLGCSRVRRGRVAHGVRHDAACRDGRTHRYLQVSPIFAISPDQSRARAGGWRGLRL